MTTPSKAVRISGVRIQGQRPLKAKIAELEEQIEAIGAGGVTSGQKMIRGRQ